jgi:predicted MFS family arabinose efflux permease
MEEVRPPAVPTGVGEDAAASRRRIPALLAGYWAFGQFWGVYVIMITGLRERHGLSYSENGQLLTMLSITAVVVMAFVAPRLAPFPLRTVVPVSLVTLGLGSAALALAPGTAILVLAFAVVGAGNGLIDVFMNVDAQRVEVVTRRPVLQWLHASYAAGGVTGAAVGGIAGSVGLDFRFAFGFAAAALVVTALMNVAVGTSEASATNDSALRFSLSAFLRHRGLWVVGLAVLFAFLVEGSMDTWSGQYMQDQLGATAGETALAFAAFSASLFLGRLFAGRVLFGLGARATILIAGVGAAVGGAIVATTDSTLVVGAAFLLMGFSIAAAAPAAFGLVERIAPADQANAIAAITTVGYSGFVWSPPIFGWLADAFSLRTAMAVIVSTTIGIIVAGLLATSARLGAADDRVSRRG